MTQQSGISVNSLKVDFYESGVGETIIVTFPDGGVGIIDAHPSNFSHRPNIEDLVDGKKIHFVCLSHPHADHGKDLIPILKDHPAISSFWHSISDVGLFVFTVSGQIQNYRSPLREVVKEFHRGWGTFLTRIYGHVGERSLPYRKLRADLESEEIAGVKIHFLGPEESIQNKFTTAYKDLAAGKRNNYPDPNGLSVILALEYAGRVILLGADALKANWPAAMKKYRRLNLPKVAVLKVPHHGAANAIDLRRGEATYLDLCNSETVSVLFAGDADHPDSRVEERLKLKTKLSCLANGRKSANVAESNSLGIGIPGAMELAKVPPACQPTISVVIAEGGVLTIEKGFACPSSRC